MFEAHTLSAEELELHLLPAPCWQKTYHRTHLPSLRPLKIWFADGKRKDQRQRPRGTRFVYIEYQDNSGNNHYCCQEISIAGQTLQTVLSAATQLPIAALHSG